MLTGTSLTGSSTTRSRVENDFYATPPKTTQAILDHIRLNGSILEPATGQGHISEVLKANYPDQEIISTDLIDRGYGIGGIDFLTYDYGRRFDNIITNPPFKFAKEFVYRGLELANDKVIMFFKIQFLESISRREMFLNTPLRYVYVFSERQEIWANGSQVDEKGKKWNNTFCYIWCVWEIGYEGEVILRWV